MVNMWRNRLLMPMSFLQNCCCGGPCTDDCCRVNIANGYQPGDGTFSYLDCMNVSISPSSMDIQIGCTPGCGKIFPDFVRVAVKCTTRLDEPGFDVNTCGCGLHGSVDNTLATDITPGGAQPPCAPHGFLTHVDDPGNPNDPIHNWQFICGKAHICLRSGAGPPPSGITWTTNCTSAELTYNIECDLVECEYKITAEFVNCVRVGAWALESGVWGAETAWIPYPGLCEVPIDLEDCKELIQDILILDFIEAVFIGPGGPSPSTTVDCREVGGSTISLGY